MRGTALRILLGVLVGGLVVGGVIAGVKYYPDIAKLVNDKIESIKTGNPPIGNISVVRDLRGTWVSSLSGKGIQLYGKFKTGPGTTSIYEEGDVELIIKKVVGNTATGTIRYTNLCSWGTTVVPGVATVSVPRQCLGNSGANNISIGVSGTKLDFGTINTNGATFTMQGNYTTDIISGTMTANVPPYGVIKGEFHLMRKK